MVGQPSGNVKLAPLFAIYQFVHKLATQVILLQQLNLFKKCCVENSRQINYYSTNGSNLKLIKLESINIYFWREIDLL